MALLPFVLLIVLFELSPLVMVIVRSFMPTDSIGFTLEQYRAIFTKKLYLQAISNSVSVSVISACVGLVVAFFGAKAVMSTKRKNSFFMGILNMTSNFSGIPLAFASMILLGNVGVLVMFGKRFGIEALATFNIYSFGGLLITYIYFQIPLATLLLIPAFEGIRKEWREAVSLLGGSSLHFWLKVGVPVLLPSLLGTLSVLFSNAIAAYATAYALLQNNFSLLPIRISEQFVGDIVQRKEFGSALAVVLMLLMVGAILMNQAILKRNKRVETA
jgi:putative spermidine/putrescine transport system permease protein